MISLLPTRVLCALLLVLGPATIWAQDVGGKAFTKYADALDFGVSSNDLAKWIDSEAGAELPYDEILELLSEADNAFWKYFPSAWIAGLFGDKSAKPEKAD